MGDQSVKDGTLDLEKELSCSICTDVFYQPLTLLDCLHTFCGSCLKEWFSWQASAATTEHPYTCPACRAHVRGTKPNATVTTLLDMLLRAHPDREKSQKDKDEIAESYKPGDDVIPPVDIARESDDSEDERMLESARELSLHDMEDRPSTRRTRTHAGSTQDRQRRRRDGDDGSATYLSYRPDRAYNHGHGHGGSGGRAHQSPTALDQARQLDHQSSLRSLVSASEPDSVDIQEEIMRQIMDEGLLEGIDLNNLTPAQEEDITERIAHAFRRRQRDHSRHRRRAQPRPASPSSPPSSSSSSRSHRQSSNPPLSRPRLHDLASEQPRRQRDRTSSHASRASVRSASAVTRSEESLTPPHTAQSASRSATDLSPYTRATGRARPPSDVNRRTTDPDFGVGSAISHRTSTASSRQQAPQHVRPPSSSIEGHRMNGLGLGLANNSSPVLPTYSAPRSSTDRDERLPASSHTTSSPLSSGSTMSIPSVSCSRCEKPDIQYSVHYHCPTCALGDFNLCLSCYRAGKGCRHWYGFGYAAMHRYQRLLTQGDHSVEQVKPHIMSARRYKSTPASLEEGLFCEGCLSFADECYWHCSVCNEGTWGFCNDCVPQAKHCTHPLQCIGRVSRASDQPAQSGDIDRGPSTHPAPLNTSKPAFHFLISSHAPTMSSATLPHVPDPSCYAPLTLAVSCDICRHSIPPSNTRFHCHVCNDGNYDICATCYHTLGNTGKIRSGDGSQGWRRCLQGHRMSIVGFEDREGGSKRVVVRDFVGGWALKEDGGAPSQSSSASPGQWKWREEDGTSASQTSKLHHPSVDLMPPDGGVGMRTQALWSRFPPDDVQDELTFPRNGIITEVENINGDWYWGVYAGKKGLFPGNFVRIV